MSHLRENEQCQDCGSPYKAVYRVPDDVWRLISPTDDGSGLLCIDCADFQARRAGIVLFWEAAVGEYPGAVSGETPE